MQLNFKPLKHAPSIQNAVVPINEHVQLSVSYGQWPGGCSVGTPGNYEAAVQMIDPRYPGIACLVSFEDNPQNNIWSGCDDAELEALIERGKHLTYAGAIEVFGIRSGETEPDWGIRFLCAEGHDRREKEKYTKELWGRTEHYRFIAQ